MRLGNKRKLRKKLQVWKTLTANYYRKNSVMWFQCQQTTLLTENQIHSLNLKKAATEISCAFSSVAILENSLTTKSSNVWDIERTTTKYQNIIRALKPPNWIASLFKANKHELKFVLLTRVNVNQSTSIIFYF